MKYMFVCVFVVKRCMLIVNYVYHLTSLRAEWPATSYTVVEMQYCYKRTYAQPN